MKDTGSRGISGSRGRPQFEISFHYLGQTLVGKQKGCDTFIPSLRSDQLSIFSLQEQVSSDEFNLSQLERMWRLLSISVSDVAPALSQELLFQTSLLHPFKNYFFKRRSCTLSRISFICSIFLSATEHITISYNCIGQCYVCGICY